MAQAIISEDKGRIVLQTPFSRDFVDELKQKSDTRKWDATKKVWTVDATEADLAIEIAGRYFEVLDARDKSTDEIEEAQIDAEIAKIKSNQAYIQERADFIKRVIEELSNQISRYSFQSKSQNRYAMAQDRALLQHALYNAGIPVENMAEMQVRGLAAAVRLLEAPQTPKYWPFGWNV
jgi:hypothetical protein